MKTIMQPIEMIQINDKDGKIKPFRIKVPIDQTETEVYDISNVMFLTEKKEEGKLSRYYKCKAVVNDVLRDVELQFIKDECRWFLYRV